MHREPNQTDFLEPYTKLIKIGLRCSLPEILISQVASEFVGADLSRIRPELLWVVHRVVLQKFRDSYDMGMTHDVSRREEAALKDRENRLMAALHLAC